ncbi:MAG: pentapeptide repeat-containing protein [Pseudomonadota bacterium]
MTHLMKFDLVDAVALCFLAVGGLLVSTGLLLDERILSELFRMLVEEWSPGFVIDGMLLLALNRIVRRNERRGVLAQIGSLSAAFALDAVRRARSEGWLEDGSLQGARLKKAQLARADLSGADLRGADLRFADLEGASLCHADLTDAQLLGANLLDADLRFATMRGAQLRWAELRGARLENVVLNGADLTFCSVDDDFAAITGSDQGVTGGHLQAAQVEALRSSLAVIEQDGEQAIDRFYENLFIERPELRSMFSSSRARQNRKFLQSLRMIISTLDEPERSVEVLEQLGARHAGYGVQREHYDLAGSVLLRTLEEVLGEGFTVELKAAWTAAFSLIAGVMIDAGNNSGRVHS